MISQHYSCPKKVRAHFPQLDSHPGEPPYCYLDSAATTLKPRAMIEALTQFYARDYATVHRSIYPKAQAATKRYEEVRAKIARLFLATPEQIVFTKGTTEALNLLATTLGRYARARSLKARVHIERQGHHANIVPWQLAARDFPLELVPHAAMMPAFEAAALQEEGAATESLPLEVASFAHVSNVTGRSCDLATIAKVAKPRGFYLFVDGAQGAGALFATPEDERKELLKGVDAYCLSAHKLYGPTGLGILYLSKELLEILGPYQGGGEMIDRVEPLQSSFAPAPLLFEAGTPPIAQVIGFGATLDFLEQLDLAGCYERIYKLRASLAQQMEAIPGLKILGDAPQSSSSSCIIHFQIEGAHPLDVATLLGYRGVALRSGHHCAQIALRDQGYEATLRLSLGIYTSEEEIEYFLKMLQEVLEQLRS